MQHMCMLGCWLCRCCSRSRVLQAVERWASDFWWAFPFCGYGWSGHISRWVPFIDPLTSAKRVQVICTSPGYAKDYVQKSEKPSSTVALPLSYHDPERGSSHHIGGPSYEDMTAMLAAAPSRPPPIDQRHLSVSGDSTRAVRRGDLTSPSLNAELSDMDTEEDHSRATTSVQHGTESSTQRIPVRKLRKQTPSAIELARARSKDQQRRHGWLAVICCCLWCSSRDQPRKYISRRPPTTPVLDPLRRYCDKDGFIKPHRAHHCRTCGTCVLKYDHHCPWIGQCVGARNQKFFYNFCQAACVCCVYIAASLLPFTVRGFNVRGLDVNPQQLVVVAL